jgi:murein DD-endopeptidase MepM/ murein hydrolase activator NlpD
VAEGDTLSRIAKNHGVSVAALKAANGDSDSVRIGQELKIPASGAAVAAAKPAAKLDPVQTASTPPKPEKLAATEKPQLTAYTPPQKAKAIEAVESESDDAAPNATGIGRMRWPAKGRVAKSRDGIDIQVPEGTAIKAAENGVVIYAGDGLKDFGNTVLVRHENGLVTVYGHASALNVKRGQKVKRGEQLATSGMSGEATQPKLHFEVRKDSAPVDPSKYLE